MGGVWKQIKRKGYGIKKKGLNLVKSYGKGRNGKELEKGVWKVVARDSLAGMGRDR